MGHTLTPHAIHYFRGLTWIATPSRVYLIDTGNEGRAQDSRHPPPHPPVVLFLTDKPDESRPCVAGGGGGARRVGGGGPGGGGAWEA